jgi:alpha-L-arabinofuranosidase
MQITISDKKRAKIAQDMIGLFFEDINYGADGGLYAEMIENRSFEFLDAYGDKADYYCVFDGQYGWNLNPINCKANMLIVTGSPVAEENPHYLRFTAKEAGVGFSNKAYNGIALKKDDKYLVSFYARTIMYDGKLTVSVQKDGVVYASSEVHPVIGIQNEEKNWVKYEVELSASKDVEGALFVITLEETGTIEFDFISMIPRDAVAGTFRKDIFDLLKDLNPGFIRFPGGCVLEGNTLANRYRFKDTLKPAEQRRSNWNRWAVHGNREENNFHGEFSHYNQTLGIGYYEYFLLCELLGAKPLPVLNVGLACQYQSFELVEPESEEFKQYLQDALDLIEFANGGVDTTWGAVRANMGHPTPFGLDTLGIGNEQWETTKARFFERYTIFEKAIHEKYPEIRLIGSAGPDITSDKYENAWKFYNTECKKNENFVYAVDEHYYVKPEWFYEHTDFYDKYPRDVKVFAGEYAAHPADNSNTSRKNTLEGALAEAAFLTGVERNADVVVLASYAPLLARVGYTQWAPDMIWFDDTKAYASPSYYVQKLYSKYKGSVTLDTKGEEKELEKSNIYYNTVLDETTNDIYVKVVNANDNAVSIEFLHEEGKSIYIAQTLSIGGKEKDSWNSLEAPEMISLIEQTPNDKSNQIMLEKNTFAVLVIKE